MPTTSAFVDRYRLNSPSYRFKATKQREKPQTQLEFSSVEMLKACLATSDGVTMIPEVTVRGEIARGDLAVLQWEDEHTETGAKLDGTHQIGGRCSGGGNGLDKHPVTG